MGLDGSLELVSWNVAGRVRRLDEQVEQIAGLQADAVCLQELTASTLPVWRERLLDTGYATVEHPHVSTAGERTRPLFVLSAWREVAPAGAGRRGAVARARPCPDARRRDRARQRPFPDQSQARPGEGDHPPSRLRAHRWGGQAALPPLRRPQHPAP